MILTLWCSSYFSLNPNKISKVSSLDGSFTFTGWNLLSNAESFSIYFLYSSIVVAPIHWISPRANDGFNILEASIAPSAPPAPIIVWISSINTMIFLFFIISSIVLFNRSSNSPLYFAPAIIDVKSNATTLFSRSTSGISPLTIFCARPSTTAVFPTPGSPIKHGLFFILLHNISNNLWFSFSLPITGSNIPSRANSVRSLPYLSSIGVFSFLLLSASLSIFLSSYFPDKNNTRSSLIPTKFNCNIFKMVYAIPSSWFIIANKICSGETYLWFSFLASITPSSRSLFTLGVLEIYSNLISPNPIYFWIILFTLSK